VGIRSAGDALMAEDREADQSSRAEGFLSGIGDSLRHHVDERLKSPFGGAFIVAWFAINWQLILILLFSEKKIEDRIVDATNNYIDWWNGLLLPVALAVAIALGFYLLSAFFLVIFEFYELAKRKIKRRFDLVSWRSPEQYLEMKRGLGEQIESLRSLATDNLEQVEVEKKKTKEFADKLLTVQEELSEATSLNARLASEKSDLIGDASGLKSQISINQESLSALQEKLALALSEVAKNRDELIAMREKAALVAEALKLTSAPTHPGAWNMLLGMKDVPQSQPGDSEYRGSRMLTMLRRHVESYLRSRFSALPVNGELLDQLLNDIEKSGLRDRAQEARFPESVIERTIAASLAYAQERPELFKSSVDYFSKGLGFLYPEFHQHHRYSKQTRDAFKRFSHLVTP
jgi:hypothetical protein